MSYVFAGVAVAGVATQVVGGIQASNAAARAAREQQMAAEDFKNYVQKQQDTATGMVLNPSTIAAHERVLNSQTANVQRLNTLASNLEPTLVEAGKQTAQLLQGKSAPVLANIQQQRQVQRQQMLDNLRTQLGPGAETSTAGMQAMQRFDLQTSDIMNQVQQQYLDKVSGIAISGPQALGQVLNQADAVLGEINKNSPQAQAAQLIEQFTNGPGSTAQQSIVGSAGGEQKGAQLMGQMMGNVGGEMVQLGAIGAGMQASKTAPNPGGGPGTGGGTGGGLSADRQYEGSGFSAEQMAADRAGGGIPSIASAPVPGSLGASLAKPVAAAKIAGVPSTANSSLGFSLGYGKEYYDPRGAPVNQFGYNPGVPSQPGSGYAGGW